MTRGTIQRRLMAENAAPLAADSKFLLDFIWASLTGKH